MFRRFFVGYAEKEFPFFADYTISFSSGEMMRVASVAS